MSPHSCWNHFRNMLDNNERVEKEIQSRITKRTREFMDEGFVYGTALWMAFEEVKWGCRSC